ncbi:MAG TPA: hypothetical protein PKD00_05545 [Burkholderiales bacterium]|nr:hypothetical protein [Burkholderiales bacterium]
MNNSPSIPSFKYTAIRTNITDKKNYINKITSSIQLYEDVKLFKEILMLFTEQTYLFKYKNTNEWFSYEPYKQYFNNSNESKVKDWLDNLFKISKHRNPKLFFGKAFDTKSLKELLTLFNSKLSNVNPLNLTYKYEYINKEQLNNLAKTLNKPLLEYSLYPADKDSKFRYISNIIESIKSKDDITLFKRILDEFSIQTKKLKYKNLDEWFSYEPYKRYYLNNSNEKKIKNWLDNLFIISKHRNPKLFFGVAFDTKSLNELKNLFKDISVDFNKFKNFTYISEKQLKELQDNNKWIYYSKLNNTVVNNL